jgi:hypothetical protein
MRFQIVLLVYPPSRCKPFNRNGLSPVHKIDYIGKKENIWRWQSKALQGVPMELPSGVLLRVVADLHGVAPGPRRPFIVNLSPCRGRPAA